MIGTLVFILAFVLLGLGVVFVAFSGGPRGAAQRRSKPPSLAARRALGVAVGLVVAGIGVAVPTLVSVANGDDSAKRAPGGVDLTSEQQAGRAVFAHNCSTCHTLRASNAVGKVGPNLDLLVGPLQNRKGFVLSAIAEGRARGQGQMPARLVTGPDADAVASYVAAVAGR